MRAIRKSDFRVQRASVHIFSFLFGFIMGIAGTVFAHWFLRRRWTHDPHRAEKLAGLSTLRTWLESYRALFDAVYPECPELILAHKMLSPQYPHYDKTAPVKLYESLKEYRSLQAKHDALTKQAEASLQSLADRNLDRLYGVNKKVSAAFHKFRLSKDALVFPVSFPTDIQAHLAIIDQYRQKVFEDFPCKIVRDIEWAKLDHLPPDQLSTVVHPQLHYFQADEDISRDREKESKLFDEMQNLSFYRIVAKREIDQILTKIHRQEERYGLS